MEDYKLESEVTVVQMQSMPDALHFNLRHPSGAYRVWVYFDMEARVMKGADIDKIIKMHPDMAPASDTLLIVAATQPSGPFFEAALNAWANSKIFVQVFTLDELQLEQEKHVLVPKHQLLTAKEAADVLAKYTDGSDPNVLPLLHRDDIQARILGCKPGDIVRIDRKSPTAGTAPAYKLVVNYTAK
jgi:DNA-directed RNA polymerase subunit H